jgi:hypothetical protein
VIELSERLITSISVSDERAIDHFFGMINERAIDLFLVIKGQVTPETNGNFLASVVFEKKAKNRGRSPKIVRFFTVFLSVFGKTRTFKKIILQD